MSESKLKKEFNPKDVNRIRNLIQKKFGNKTIVQAGYNTSKVKREEGDQWEENGKTWTIKDGIKQNITKFDTFKKLAIMPILCPKCSTPMKTHKLNTKMYGIHGVCFNCVIEMETELKRLGLYVEYEKRVLNNNKNSMVIDLESFIKEYDNKTISVSENGETEDWSQSSNNNELMELQKFLSKLKETTL